MSWKKIKIGDCCEITSSKRIFYSDYVSEGVPFYRGKEIIEKSDGKPLSEPLYISEEKYNEIKKRFGVPSAGDLLLTSVGTIGIPYIVKNDDYFYFKDGNLTWFKDFNNNASSKFLYYWFLSPKGRAVLYNSTIGSSQKALTISTLKDLKFQCPSLDQQLRIIKILESYDSLIENNQKQIKLLEEAAQRLYKEWFVDLRFPGYEKVKIIDGLPEGWKNGYIKEVIDYHDTKRIPLSSLERSAFKGPYRYYGAAGILDYVAKYLFDGRYLLLGEDGSVITNDGYPVLQYVDGKFWVNNHAHVLTGKKPFTTEYIYMMFKNMKVIDIVTGVAQPKISQDRLSNKKAIIPSDYVLTAFQNFCKEMFDKIILLEKQIQLLKEARDRLLPKLMNGEVEL